MTLTVIMASSDEFSTAKLARTTARIRVTKLSNIMMSLFEKRIETEDKLIALEHEYKKFDDSVKKLEVASSNMELACKGEGVEVVIDDNMKYEEKYVDIVVLAMQRFKKNASQPNTTASVSNKDT